MKIVLIVYSFTLLKLKPSLFILTIPDNCFIVYSFIVLRVKTFLFNLEKKEEMWNNLFVHCEDVS